MRSGTKNLCLMIALAGAFLLGGATVVFSVKCARAKHCRAKGACAADAAAPDGSVPAGEVEFDEN